MKQKKLDLKKEIKRLDTKSVGLSIAALKHQIGHVALTFPKRISFRSSATDAIVICAMGGSGLGVDVLKHVYKRFIRVPVTIVHGYSLPSFVNRRTLVILISYSGSTEEIIACLQEARHRNAKIFVIASGGALIRRAKTLRAPFYEFTAEANPSGQPRLGTGYTMAATYLLLKHMKLITRPHPDMIVAARSLQVDPGRALSFAQKLQGKSLLVIGAEHLQGNAHVFSNQMNESAKIFAPYYAIPELNHHLLEGLESLRSSRRHWIVVFLESDLYPPRIKKRVALTRRVMEKQGFSTLAISFKGTAVSQCLQMLSFCSWVSYYCAILAKKDPSTIPWVDYFKERL